MLVCPSLFAGRLPSSFTFCFHCKIAELVNTGQDWGYIAASPKFRVHYPSFFYAGISATVQPSASSRDPTSHAAEALSQLGNEFASRSGLKEVGQASREWGSCRLFTVKLHSLHLNYPLVCHILRYTSVRAARTHYLAYMHQQYKQKEIEDKRFGETIDSLTS